MRMMITAQASEEKASGEIVYTWLHASSIVFGDVVINL